MSPNLIRTLAAVAALAVGAAACGSGTDTEASSTDDGAIATLSDETTESSSTDAEGDSGPASTTTDEAEAPDDPELAYALYDDCMAEQGFDFQTSIAGDGDNGAIEIDGDSELGDPQAQSFDDADDFGEAFDTANAECEKHLANVDTGFDLDPEQQALFEDAQLEWAACMRDAGFDIPEMDGDGGAISFEIGGDESDPQSGELGGNDFDFEAFEEAAEGCNGAFEELDEILGSSEGTEG
ncbi:MAG: hypothetical protein AAGE98_04995 [Actinomycetota bacterium]